ncbi:ATP synthase [Burkholderia ubonensis]|uniref:type III secretion system ATPase SctN n=1 Tax=Burkholderia ubonensis TaxID=101571 RepID=UPI00075D6439|nr:type III secretion system ATPase SctN [Burkholderia ubonensis]KVN98516.1 ATP synthase [Burkholderia ubonensis]
MIPRYNLRELTQRFANPRRIKGQIIEARLRDVSIGELCVIHPNAHSDTTVARAQVVGFGGDDVAILSLLGSPVGLSRDAVLVPTGQRFSIDVGPWMLGTVLSSTGACTQVLRSREVDVTLPTQRMHLEAPPPDYLQRRPVDSVLETGVRVVDALLTCGVGQRFGIFAAAGCGKTSLMNMLIDHSVADVYVVALVGERGREVTEFVERLKASVKRENTIVVYSTSDCSAVDRCNAALLATTVAEYFRGQGADVMLFLDSMTRYARALRDVALAAGEAPARRGYPASVFEAMPRLLERPGRTADGSITAFYTVLLENEEEPDPIGDEIRSILDGHIYLSRKLAGKGVYPAIDVLKSASRLFGEVTDDEQQRAAAKFRMYLAKLDDIQVFLDMGEYRRGENLENDAVLDRRERLNEYLKQRMDESSPFMETLEGLYDAVA